MSNSIGKFIIQRASESQNEFWTGSGWSENENDARQYALEPNAGEVTGDESAKAVLVADSEITMRHV